MFFILNWTDLCLAHGCGTVDDASEAVEAVDDDDADADADDEFEHLAEWLVAYEDVVVEAVYRAENEVWSEW